MKRSLRRIYAAVVHFFRPSDPHTNMFNKTKNLKLNKSAKVPLEKAVETLSLHDATSGPSSQSTALSLPDAVVEDIFRHLNSHDALVLSATCTKLRSRATWAYRELHFVLGRPELPKTLAMTLESIQLLLAVLRSCPHYASNIHSITLYDAIPSDLITVKSDAVPWMAWNLLVESLDEHVSQLLSLTPMLRQFVWSDYSVGTYMSAQRTIPQLRKLQHLQTISIFRVHGPLSNQTLSSRILSPKPERLWIDTMLTDPHWILPFLQGNNQLRSLDLRHVGDARDVEWFRELSMVGIAWRKLQTLNVTCTEEGAQGMITLMKHCAACESWPSLTSVSFNPISGRVLINLMHTLRSFPIRRLHIVVNDFGTYPEEFGPELVSNIFTYLPDLEELVLDHTCNTTLAPLPGTLEEWGRALRMAPKLRVLTIPTLCVTDGSDMFQHQQNNHGSDEDTLMDETTISSMSYSSSKPDSTSYLPATSTSDSLPKWLQPLYLPLSIFAEDFVDIHLRSPVFKELRFIHNIVPPNPYSQECRMIRFGQELDPDAPGEQYMMTFSGIMCEGPAEDDAFFWTPRSLRRSQ